MNIKKLNKYVTQVMRNFPNVDGIIITDTDAVVRYYFTAYENMSNVAGNEIIGKKAEELVPLLKSLKAAGTVVTLDGEEAADYMLEKLREKFII